MVRLQLGSAVWRYEITWGDKIAPLHDSHMTFSFPWLSTIIYRWKQRHPEPAAPIPLDVYRIKITLEIKKDRVPKYSSASMKNPVRREYFDPEVQLPYIYIYKYFDTSYILYDGSYPTYKLVFQARTTWHKSNIPPTVDFGTRLLLLNTRAIKANFPPHFRAPSLYPLRHSSCAVADLSLET